MLAWLLDQGYRILKNVDRRLTLRFYDLNDVFVEEDNDVFVEEDIVA